MGKPAFVTRVVVLLIFILASAFISDTRAARAGVRANESIPSVTSYAFLPMASRQEPGSVFVLSNHSYYVTSWNSLHIIGEVQNNKKYNITAVRVGVDLFNRSGLLLDTGSADLYLKDLPAGEKTCFDITFLYPPSGWSTFQFKTPAYTPGGSPPNLKILKVSGDYDAASSDYVIDGQVRNDQGSTVECVKPVGTLYNAAGKVIGCSFTYVESTHLNPGQKSSFELAFYGRNYADVDSYQLQVDGQVP